MQARQTERQRPLNTCAPARTTLRITSRSVACAQVNTQDGEQVQFRRASREQAVVSGPKNDRALPISLESTDVHAKISATCEQARLHGRKVGAQLCKFLLFTAVLLILSSVLSSRGKTTSPAEQFVGDTLPKRLLCCVDVVTFLEKLLCCQPSWTRGARSACSCSSRAEVKQLTRCTISASGHGSRQARTELLGQGVAATAVTRSAAREPVASRRGEFRRGRLRVVKKGVEQLPLIPHSVGKAGRLASCCEAAWSNVGCCSHHAKHAHVTSMRVTVAG